MCSKIKIIKEFKTTSEFIRVCSKIKRIKEFKTCDLFSYYRFKMESGKLKSYTLAFKKRVKKIQLEENDNNISTTVKEFNIQRKIWNDGFNRKTLFLKLLRIEW